MRARLLLGLVVLAVAAIGGVGAFFVFADEGTELGTVANGENGDGAAAAAEPSVETVAEGFDQPWGLAFLPGEDGELLMTEAAGTLSLVNTESRETSEISGVPEVDTGGQGGLLDVAPHPDFSDSPWVYLTYSASDDTGATSTHLARGMLDLGQDSLELEDVEELFAAEPFEQATDHYGSKIAFDPDGYLFMTIGDRGDKNFDDHPSQDTSTTIGTTLRFEPDGSVPQDNPFVDDADFADEIYSYGHRNVQGMTVHPETGELWQSEHGEQDGDEINIVEAGGNYGWPEAHTGCEYGTDEPVGDDPTERDDIVDPVHHWACNTGGFAPAGITFYQGEEFPDWEGDLLVSGLAPEELTHFTVEGTDVEEGEPLLADEGWRIRNVTVGPHDGAIYVAIDTEDAPLVRIVND